MNLISAYWPKAPWLYAYMLQQFESDPQKFLAWAVKLPNLFAIQKRGKMVLTARAKLMVLVAYVAWLIPVVIGLAGVASGHVLWLVALVFAPGLSVLALFIISSLLQALVVSPSQQREVSQAKSKLGGMQAQRIAVLGSYGKTTMKELLVTVLGEGKKVAATPGNKNVLVSHARWLNREVTGNEDVLIFEYGEGAPGDIAKLASLSEPQLSFVTGLAPAHLDKYPTLSAVADDFATITQFTASENTYINAQSSELVQKISGKAYSEKGVAEWKVTNVTLSFEGMEFTVSNGEKRLNLNTGLLGKHQLGPLTAVVAIASDMGLTDQQIIDGVAQTRAFEHRMQPRHLGGAWIVDDTYNGNIEGMRAGLELLQALPAKRRIYVTPGLVDQGIETESVHNQLGQLIAAAKPDRVVLMQNSATQYIQSGLEAGNFQGELILETNPLEYYTNLEHFLAAGDVVLLQNDWPDSYK